jgi:hypothetical protein
MALKNITHTIAAGPDRPSTMALKDSRIVLKTHYDGPEDIMHTKAAPLRWP